LPLQSKNWRWLSTSKAAGSFFSQWVTLAGETGHVTLQINTSTSVKMAETEPKNDLPTISDDLVVTKYKMAAEIVNSKWRRKILLV
jgi:hypothetical protein